jgi:hypothetical protein
MEYHETVDIEVWVNDVSHLQSAKTVITYDSDLFDITAFQIGSILNSFHATIPSDPTTATGTLQVDQAVLGAGSDFTGSGRLYTVTFYAKAYGVCDLTFQEHVLKDNTASEIGHTAEDGALSVNEVLLDPSVLLQGPYAGSGTMLSALRDQGFIPLNSPHAAAPRGAASIPADVTDWVMVELRDDPEGSGLSHRSFFLKTDGSFVETDGSSPISMRGIPDGDYYIIVHHRNHLAVMSATNQALNGSSALSYDFTLIKSQTYGNDAAALDGGYFGLYAGDASGNGQVQNNDKNDYWKVQVGMAGYKDADFNCNGQVQNDDKNDLWKANVGKGSQIGY